MKTRSGAFALIMGILIVGSSLGAEVGLKLIGRTRR